ncbi:MAG: hypothetical protein P8102_07305, partial [Gammaproteobacteria bacterium]
LFVTDAFGMSANASLGVFAAMTGGFALQAIFMFREAQDQSQVDREGRAGASDRRPSASGRKATSQSPTWR